jgi:hypothetical protein
MAGMMEQLIILMAEQLSRYEDLLALSKEKRGVIIANDIEGLQKITHLENILVSQNQKLEKKREGLIADIALVTGKKTSDVTLQGLVELMEGQQEQAQLTDMGKRISHVLDALSEENGNNASLIDNALDYIEYSINIIRSVIEKDTGLYNAKGEPLKTERNLVDKKR